MRQGKRRASWERKMKQRIGFIGLGEMGFPMAEVLLKSGYGLLVYDKDKRPLKRMKGKAEVANSPMEIGPECKIVIVMVRTTKQVEDVVQGPSGVLESMQPGSTIIIMSTIDPSAVISIAESARSKRVSVLDAPVSGARQGAEKATLTIIVGGPQKAFTCCRPILESFGKSIYYMGRNGMGEVGKLINNHLLLVNVMSVYEAMDIARKARIKVPILLELLKRSTGNSWVVQNWPLVKTWKEEASRMPHPPTRDIKTLFKDIRMTLDFAKSLNTPLPLAALASQLNWP